MKTEKELNELKEEVNNLRKKLTKLSEEELKQVVGGYRKDIGSDKNAKVIFS